MNKDDIFTKCEWNGKPPDGIKDCESFLDDADGVGRCWCYRYMDGNEWCNIVNCEKDVNTKT
jgi:hypothetical protein